VSFNNFGAVDTIGVGAHGVIGFMLFIPFMFELSSSLLVLLISSMIELSSSSSSSSRESLVCFFDASLIFI
jgi:hypothetical protein